MRIRPKTRVQLYQVLGITVFWISCGAFLAVYKCVTYDTLSGQFIFAVPQELELGKFVLINMIGPAIGGVIGGGFLVFVLNDRLRRKSYLSFLLISMLYLFTFIFILNATVSYFFYFKGEIAESESQLIATFRYLIRDPYAIRNIVTWLIISMLTLFALRIYEKYGPTAIIGLLKGDYHRAHEVERVFLFIDITDSTTLAEKLGHIRFFQLLSDFYADVTDPILNSRGEIHQYIGDEVVIAWPLHKAVTRSPHCLLCFYRIERAIEQKKAYYLKNYGVQLSFKGALHSGKVVMGEMGVIKREIVYSGDILNTTARMVEQCKVYNQNLIISQEVIDLVPQNLIQLVSINPLGELVLRGKHQSVRLFGVLKTEETLLTL